MKLSIEKTHVSVNKDMIARYCKASNIERFKVYIA